MKKTETISTQTKHPFDIHRAMNDIRTAVQPFPKAALFALYDDGYTSLFEQLIACLISVRTYDETTMLAAPRLFALARTPQEMAKLPVERIDAAIAASTFHEAKAPQIKAIAQQAVEQFNGELPCDVEVLTSFRGIGPKCAGLALGIVCGQGFIGVDIHVHRVTNRWGYVQARTPEQTMKVLQAKLPREYFVEINRLLVPFGKHICTGSLPKCSTCPVLDMCQQVGVEKHR